jgi:hypothetical protein
MRFDNGQLTYGLAVSVGHHFAIHEHWLFFALTDESFGVTTSGLPVIRQESVRLGYSAHLRRFGE